MQILQEMPNFVFWEISEKYFKMKSTEIFSFHAKHYWIIFMKDKNIEFDERMSWPVII